MGTDVNVTETAVALLNALKALTERATELPHDHLAELATRTLATNQIRPMVPTNLRGN